ncbi:MAG: TIR domain-containing protein [Proteocatella sp.]
MINIFIPHRWNNRDFIEISALLDRTKYQVRDYSVPASSPFDRIDRRYNVDPQIQKQIRYASVVVCSNRPANNNGIAIDEIKYAVSLGKPVVAIKITDSTSQEITGLGISVIAKRKDSLEFWIGSNSK